jgi:hypothetical protein
MKKLKTYTWRVIFLHIITKRNKIPLGKLIKNLFYPVI